VSSPLGLEQETSSSCRRRPWVRRGGLDGILTIAGRSRECKAPVCTAIRTDRILGPSRLTTVSDEREEGLWAIT
jgi:hypothetical protein